MKFAFKSKYIIKMEQQKRIEQQKEMLRLTALEKALHFASMNYYKVGQGGGFTKEQVIEIAVLFEDYLSNKK